MALVSIIIPNYNRENLIGETLDSIIIQTYTNWECIIIDDGSTDESVNVIQNYVDKDKRFKFYHRPKDYPKGANACRNIGIEKAKGDYIIFFDSDDLMLENHIEVKLKLIIADDRDFVITRSLRFYNDDPNDLGGDLSGYDVNEVNRISPDNYIQNKNFWLTIDLIIKYSIANKIRFTEEKSSAEEYNYFVKLTLLSTNAVYNKSFLALRRMHSLSVSSQIKSTEYNTLLNKFYYYWNTLNEIDTSLLKRETINFMVDQCVLSLYRLGANNFSFSKKKLLKWIIYRKGILRGIYNYLFIIIYRR